MGENEQENASVEEPTNEDLQQIEAEGTNDGEGEVSEPEQEHKD